MNALVVGSGAREHALGLALSKSDLLESLYFAPGNAGTDDLGANIPLNVCNNSAVSVFCQEKAIDTVLIGPEDPLAEGLADVLRSIGVSVFGPGAEAARLESSKAFARARSETWGIPTAKTRLFTKKGEFERFMSSLDYRVVLKKSGLAAGKGVLESEDPKELLDFGRKILAEDGLLVEEFLKGFELSVFALCDGENWVLLPPCMDHKKAGEGDSGPNTGGMGAICPVPLATVALMREIEGKIVEPTFRGMKAEGLAYRGVVFFGIMVDESGPKLLEYNVRFGDPETQSLIPLWKDDFGEVIHAVSSGSLRGYVPCFSRDYAVGVVVAAPGYPGSYPKAILIDNMPEAVQRCFLFHASTSHDSEGNLRTGGGRCFTAVGIGETFVLASAAAYGCASQVRFPGAWFRRDIGNKVFGAKP